MRRFYSYCILFCMLLMVGCTPAVTALPKADAAISFTDDMGQKIALEQPAKRIISLYSTHTENLYAIGAGEQLIGAYKTSTFPPEAAFLPRFDYNADPEIIIAAQPDLVISRPFVDRKVPDLIQALTKAGIPVVSLYPNTLDDFDAYIETLGVLTGKEVQAQEKLTQFHQRLEEIKRKPLVLSTQKGVFMESTENELRTVTPDSMPGLAITFAGGINIAADAVPTESGTSIAAFGEEKILEHADEIDAYVSLRGAMNAGGNEHSISIRPGFHAIRAVQEGRILLINEKLISSPSFRYVTGVEELARFLYPSLMDDLSSYKTNQLATKADLAHILFSYAHIPVFVPSSSSYYETEQKGHTYGLFQDVPWTHQDFDIIEAVVQRGLLPWETEGEDEMFYPEQPVTRQMLAKAVFLLKDFENQEQNTAIQDLADCEQPRLIQILVDNGIFTLTDGNFLPNQEMTQEEILYVLQGI